MRYRIRVSIRIVLVFLSLIFGYKLLYFFLSPATFYASYYSLFFLDPLFLDQASFAINGVKLIFIPACVAASAYLLLLLLTFLTDIDFSKAVKMFLLGVIFIFAGNLLRIDFLIFILLKYGSQLFRTLHLFVWDVVSTLYVVLVWIILTKIFKVKEIPIYSDFNKFYEHHKEARNFKK